MELGEVMRLIEKTARWVDPETFRLLPVWYPEYGRRAYFYNADWSEPRHNTNRETGQKLHKQEGNLNANKALTTALGLRSKERPNWSCCHIWGLDDPLFQEANAVVQDRRFYSCVANMVLLPTPLKAFTDAMPEVKAMLRICARNLYGWTCDHESLAQAIATIDGWSDWTAYPASWPRAPGPTATAPGVVPLNDNIRRSAERRINAIRVDMEKAGSFYPRDEVASVLSYWGIDLGTWPHTASGSSPALDMR
jgi:hypothetical protein